MNGVSDVNLEETETQFRCAVNGMILCSSFILNFIGLFLSIISVEELCFPPRANPWHSLIHSIKFQ